MTVGGYHHARHAGRALVKNKGSRGREEKTIYFTEVIEAQLLTYIRTERATHDPQGRNRLEELDDLDPLFLTARGIPYTRTSFYHHWSKLLEPAQRHFKTQERVEFSPHDIRHLRVSRAITTIKQQAKGDRGLEEELVDGFRQLMGWRSRETMETYIHSMGKREALLSLMLADEQDKPLRQDVQGDRSQPLVKDQPPKGKVTAHTAAPGPQDEAEFSWYEE